MARLDKEKIADIKASVNIVDVISQYVHLSKSGTHYLGLCPFHGEKTPSFNVNAAKQFFHCFGCGKSGDVFRFLEEYKQETFIEAVKEIADSAGIELTVDESPRRENPNQALYDLHNQAARIYHTMLTSTEEGAKARLYLAERGISDAMIEQFNIGLSLSDLDFFYQSVKHKFEEAVLANSGLVTFAENRIFDSFRGRIMFPLNNEFGQVIAFSGRIWRSEDLDNKQLAKYRNSTLTPIFNKSEALYNLDKAKNSIKKLHEVYLMEGFMDVIAAAENGLSNVVASMGTALTVEHVKKLRQLAQKFVLVYDGDKAGQNAIFKALNLLEANDEVEIVRIPDGLDPDEYNKLYPRALAPLMVNSRLAPVEFLMDYLRPENLSNLQSQLEFIDLMAAKIAAVKSLTAQDAYVKRLVEILPDFEYNQVEAAVNQRRQNVVERQEILSEEQFYFDDGLAPPPLSDEFGYLPDFQDVSEFQFQPPVQQQAQFQLQEVMFSPPQKLSRIEISESHLLHRMIYHSHVLKRIMSEPNFQFVHKRYQQLFEVLKTLEKVDEPILSAHLTERSVDEELATFYEILSSVNVPDEVADQEIEDLLKNFVKATKQSQLEALKGQLEQAKQAGNKALELQLTLQIIAHKQQDGV
ncbi:DNA primase [Lactococcus hodotermopsidis]|uniref:DNA primase n=1 Tax=Pseudolactococcus hodotermopsidis TaxID=2709157 RepID=A0A6A0BDE0_9LACT|nr:DNA primase [Lactococcus hodotermopsidis]GFH43449.1 DNA primase [Lactococcus hodotermopsidis]